MVDKNREKIKKIQTFRITYFIKKSYFVNVGQKLFSILSFVTPICNDKILAWRTKGL